MSTWELTLNRLLKPREVFRTDFPDFLLPVRNLVGFCLLSIDYSTSAPLPTEINVIIPETAQTISPSLTDEGFLKNSGDNAESTVQIIKADSNPVTIPLNDVLQTLAAVIYELSSEKYPANKGMGEFVKSYVVPGGDLRITKITRTMINLGILAPDPSAESGFESPTDPNAIYMRDGSYTFNICLLAYVLLTCLYHSERKDHVNLGKVTSILEQMVERVNFLSSKMILMIKESLVRGQDERREVIRKDLKDSRRSLVKVAGKAETSEAMIDSFRKWYIISWIFGSLILLGVVGSQLLERSQFSRIVIVSIAAFGVIWAAIITLYVSKRYTSLVSR